MAEEKISELEVVSIETSQTEKTKNKIKKKSEISELRDNYKRNNIHIMGITEGKYKQTKIKNRNRILGAIMTDSTL